MYCCYGKLPGIELQKQTKMWWSELHPQEHANKLQLAIPETSVFFL
jgi:hypothetical protein